MKKSYLLNIINLVVLFTFFTFSNISCIDKCKDKICDHGYCFKGDCFCSEGYSGKECNIRESDKFVGLYKGNMVDGPDKQNIDINIKNNNSIDPWNIDLLLNTNNGINFNLRAYVVADTFYILKQRVSHIDSFVDNGTVVYDITVNDIFSTKGLFNKKDSALNFPLKLINPEIRILTEYQIKAKKQ